MDKDDQPKLSDFGLSSHKDNDAPCGGYKTHLPPEYFINGKNDELGDIYATGMTLFRLVNNYTNWKWITGYISEEDLRNGNIVEKIGFQPWVSQKMIKIINKAVHKDITKRFLTIDFMFCL